MSISSALGNALSGLAVTSRFAEVTSSNLSNALTDGYGRRSVELIASQRGGVGGGVRVESITRFSDPGILADRRLVDAALSGEQRGVDTLQRLEKMLGDAEDPASLGGRLALFEQSLIRASSDPASEVRLSNVLSRLNDLTTTLSSNDRSIQGMRQEADAAIARDIETLNSALLQVADFNKDILRVKSIGQDPSSLLDQRQNVVDRIAEIVPVREISRENGSIVLMTTNGTTLLDSQAVQFGFEPSPTITADMTLASGALSGITLDGVPLDPVTGIGRLDGGSMGASFALRDQTLVQAQGALDGIAADLIARFQDPANDLTLAPGDMGLLTDEGGVLDPADLEGLAGRIALNPAIDPLQGGLISLLRDGLNAATTGPTGDATQLNRWIAALDVTRADIPGAASRTAAGRMAEFTSLIGATRVKADEQLSYTAARWDTLREAELAQGVDTDLELQNLLRIEQAYAANAKVIETADFMMQRLMEL
ncbi:flagellar hook-associated protein FlgK [Yoonia sediminilitoris]|uniref:Flagellar hook-associated protein 1 n=1 Tax=Yoonia sediminilitoris TaxID=1286148 RepID=A0A2T6K9S6_9RHOB|nr:flagellar hook-associated protein FlgK [Yoonia sediminilitoris]PUB11552.1 flagellar hook-associated protein 1 FlgK [Yoonia sediminilitoris]RCW91752.1 flagellar hook-associated protein 1 FlgK [Yoonia sediminilitoris]